MDTNQNIKSHLYFYIIVFFSCLLIFALRDKFNGIFYPALLYEDGTELFQRFYNGEGIGYIFEYWNGYFYIIPKTVAYLLNFLPAKHIPSLYAFFSMVLAAITFVVLYEMLQGIFGKWFAVYTTLVIAALPLGYHLLITNLSFSVWNMLLILIFMYFIPVPQSKYKCLLYSIIVLAMIWSHPLSLLMFPLYIYRLRVEQKNKWVHGVFSVCTLLYFWFGMISKTVVFAKLYILPEVLFNSIVVGSVLGPVKTAYIMTYDRMSIYGAIIMFFVFAFWGLFWTERSRREKELFIVSLYLIVSTIAVSILGGNNQYDFLVPWEPVRYLYTAKILFWVLLFSACLPLIQRNFKIACIHALLIGVILMNNTLGPYNSVYMYFPSIERGEAVLEFLNRIPAQKKNCLENAAEEEFVLKDSGTGMFDIRVKSCGKY